MKTFGSKTIKQFSGNSISHFAHFPTPTRVEMSCSGEMKRRLATWLGGENSVLMLKLVFVGKCQAWDGTANYLWKWEDRVRVKWFETNCWEGKFDSAEDRRRGDGGNQSLALNALQQQIDRLIQISQTKTFKLRRDSKNIFMNFLERLYVGLCNRKTRAKKFSLLPT